MAFISACKDPQSTVMLAWKSIPWVVADSEITGVDEALVDNPAGGFQTTEYLISLGHKCISCIAGLFQFTLSAQRLMGYKQALQEAGFTLDPDLIIQSEFRSHGGYETCRILVALSDPPTAIFACNDLTAIGVLKAAHDLGLSIPQQLSIVGFNDIAWSSINVAR